MGVLFDVLFKPIGRGDSGPPPSGAAAADASQADQQAAPEWVLDKRDGGGPLVWRRRRYGPPQPCAGKRVEFLDAVQVRVFERDDYGNDGYDDGNDDDDDDDDGDDDDDDYYGGCGDGGGGGGGGGDDGVYGDPWPVGRSESLLCDTWADEDDYPVLVAVTVTVLGLCMGVAYLFAPVKWLLHHLLLADD